MATDRFQRIERLYHSALQREESQRSAFLRDACAGDDDLRQEIESLLAYGPRADNFIEAPALELAARRLARNRAHALEGRRLGAYQVVDLLGRGGMGEVYRAQDTRLGRTVAIKILPEHLSRDPQSRERFEREARTTSALNHPNICSLYDIGEQDGVGYLVMEYIDGETLAARLAKGPIPLDQALALAAQMASALAAAHSRGIVHRDFKPGNVMITSSGAKVLDFGLAKMDGIIAGEATTLTDLTQKGSILGTLHYMSPEQAEGKQLDSRSDIFSFGLVVHEMLTGVKSFLRDTPAATISALLRDEPAPLQDFIPDVAPALVQLIDRCIRKDATKRAQSMADIKLMLEEIREEIQRDSSAGRPRQTLPATHPPRRSYLWAVVAGVLALGLALGLTLIYFRRSTIEQRPLRFTVYPPPGAEFGRLVTGGTAISPDGRLLAFVARYQGTTRLWVRPFNAHTAHEVPGTDNAHHPFWSPDSRSLAFFASGKLKRVDMLGASPVVLCDAPFGTGGSWNSENTILFAGFNSGVLYRVSAAGGTPAAVTTLDTAAGERTHRWPQFLPDGRRFLYFVRSSDPEREGAYLGSLDDPRKIRVVKTASNALHAGPLGAHPAHLLWIRDGSLVAQSFDARRGQLTGSVVPVAGPVGLSQAAGFSEFSVSDDGTLVYTGGPGLSQMTWINRDGKVLGTVGRPAPYESLQISPDGKWVAAGRNEDIWLIEFARSIETRFTFASGYAPVWSPDGHWIAYRSFRNGFYNLFRKHTGGAVQEERLTETTRSHGVDDWSPDGRALLYGEGSATNDWDLWLLPLTGNGSRIPAIKSNFSEWHGQFSPDGNWIAYASDESGQREVYLQSFPKSTFRRQISNAGGDFPRWRTMEELVYAAAGKLMTVAIQPRPGKLEFSSPKLLFGVGSRSTGNFGSNWDVTPDGQRFLVLAPAGEAGSASLKVVLRWQSSLR